MKTINKSTWLAAVMGCMIVAACSKEVTVPDTADAQISFYNASEKLVGEAKLLIGGNRVFVLVDSKDTNYVPVDAISKHPFFADENPYQYPHPLSYNNKQLVQWQVYMRMAPGKHTLLLTDSSRRTLINSEVTTAYGLPVTVFYADKDGVFSTWAVPDHLQWEDNKVRLRMMNFCPDGAPVFFTINGNVPTEFAAETKYGDIQDFKSFAAKPLDTMRIKFYHTADKENPVASATLYTEAGHSYTVLLRGYENAHTYVDPVTGQNVGMPATLKAVACKNY
ncbi:DUF4397 domain-containing protein [Chitinophaga varians]|uniref:DUF4397 domain-containing protein n=1 Tax=Chitinophaga varians TaxID=2202339 RepID=UPI00165F10CD|nr:DUF4397 domain-containing protein [Chitinophaga varians]MBC9911748.1 DUF4397 domain-containing protein [Chitinophaga varians]